MIDIDQTIFYTIQEKIDRLRFLADNDVDAFKKVLYVIILHDLADWSKSIEDSHCTYNKLTQKIDEYILRNPEFIIERITNTDSYVNVNTPQTTFTWQRIWDDPEVIYNRDREISQTEDFSYKVDLKCNPRIVYFDALDEQTGEPEIDRSKLTVCEKMNIFINRSSGEAWYLREDGNWAILKGYADSVDWENVLNHPEIYQGIRHELTDDSVKVELLVDGDPENEDVKVATVDDLEDVL